MGYQGALPVTNATPINPERMQLGPQNSPNLQSNAKNTTLRRFRGATMHLKRSPNAFKADIKASKISFLRLCFGRLISTTSFAWYLSQGFGLVHMGLKSVLETGFSIFPRRAPRYQRQLHVPGVSVGIRLLLPAGLFSSITGSYMHSGWVAHN